MVVVHKIERKLSRYALHHGLQTKSCVVDEDENRRENIVVECLRLIAHLFRLSMYCLPYIVISNLYKKYMTICMPISSPRWSLLSKISVVIQLEFAEYFVSLSDQFSILTKKQRDKSISPPPRTQASRCTCYERRVWPSSSTSGSWGKCRLLTWAAWSTSWSCRWSSGSLGSQATLPPPTGSPPGELVYTVCSSVAWATYLFSMSPLLLVSCARIRTQLSHKRAWFEF